MSKKSRRRRFKGRPINVLASALTLLNLYCGIASVFACLSGLLVGSGLLSKADTMFDSAADFQKFAVALIFFALVFDSLDGTVAKVTNTTSEFGKQLDSLCDLVSFGVAPGMLIFTAFLQHSLQEGMVTAPIGSVLAVVFVTCGALRLARYNVYQAGRRDYFTGLPIPAAGITIASFSLFRLYFQMDRLALWILGPLVLLLAFLMVSTLRYPKDRIRTMVLAPGSALQLLTLIVIGIAVFDFASAQSPAIVLFPASLLYVSIGIIDYLYSVIRRKPLHEPEPSTEPRATDS